MNHLYFCPRCNATLNPNNKIIIAAANGQRHGLILFSPQPGDYEAIVADDLGLRDGDLVEMRCPVCSAVLTSEIDARMATITFKNHDTGAEGMVNFSRRFGEHATYFVTNEEIESYGDDAAAYAKMNFFGE